MKRSEIRVKAKDFIKTNLDHFTSIRKAEVEDMLTDFGERLATNDGSADVSESKSFDIHNCINEVCDAVHARFHLYGQTAKGDGSFRWRVKQAIDKMLYSR